jgi:hypothetical protein
MDSAGWLGVWRIFSSGLGSDSQATTSSTMDTIRQHLHRVRKAGFLTTVPGKAGGQLTAKAVMAVRQATPGMVSDDHESEMKFAQEVAAKLAENLT